MFDELLYRSVFLEEIMDKYASYDDSILEIGSGTGRNINYLKEHGYKNVIGIDKKNGSAIEDIKEDKYDIIFTMSTLFLIDDENVFPKIARMAKKYIMTFEGEYTSGEVIGRDYAIVFGRLGFMQVESQENMFNPTGVLRVMKRYETNN